MKKRGRDRGEDEGEDVPALAKPKGPFNNPFAAALAKAPELAAKATPPAAPGPSPAGSADGSAPVAARRVPAPARAVVRMERKGHGGKEVTVIEQLGLDARDLERWLKVMKTSLGCGGRVDGRNLVLQGDHRQSLPALLEARGVKKVTLG